MWNHKEPFTDFSKTVTARSDWKQGVWHCWFSNQWNCDQLTNSQLTPGFTIIWLQRVTRVIDKLHFVQKGSGVSRNETMVSVLLAILPLFVQLTEMKNAAFVSLGNYHNWHSCTPSLSISELILKNNKFYQFWTPFVICHLLTNNIYLAWTSLCKRILVKIINLLQMALFLISTIPCNLYN